MKVSNNDTSIDKQKPEIFNYYFGGNRPNDDEQTHQYQPQINMKNIKDQKGKDESSNIPPININSQVYMPKSLKNTSDTYQRDMNMNNPQGNEGYDFYRNQGNQGNQGNHKQGIKGNQGTQNNSSYGGFPEQSYQNNLKQNFNSFENPNFYDPNNQESNNYKQKYQEDVVHKMNKGNNNVQQGMNDKFNNSSGNYQKGMKNNNFNSYYGGSGENSNDKFQYYNNLNSNNSTNIPKKSKLNYYF
jgi:hypothetical protein